MHTHKKHPGVVSRLQAQAFNTCRKRRTILDHMSLRKIFFPLPEIMIPHWLDSWTIWTLWQGICPSPHFLHVYKAYIIFQDMPVFNWKYSFSLNGIRKTDLYQKRNNISRACCSSLSSALRGSQCWAHRTPLREKEMLQNGDVILLIYLFRKFLCWLFLGNLLKMAHKNKT